jgi:diguanylate cyclase (GGDEF)-like protein
MNWGPLARFAQGRVSRRLFFLFLLSALVPLAALALLSLVQVRSLALKQADQRLSVIAKSYGMSLFERLTLAADVELAAAAKPAGTSGNDALVKRTFSWIAIVQDDKVRAVVGTPEMPTVMLDARARVMLGRPEVIVTRDEVPRIVLLALLDPKDARIVAGELKPDGLWGPSDELPTETDFCVVEDESDRLLYCSSPMGPGALEAAKSASHMSFGSATWTRDRTTYRSRAWSQFMRAGFGTPDWVVIASQPQEYQLAHAAEFTQLFAPVAALALLIATWFTLRQSRNIVLPVAKLAERARGIAKSDFTTRLDLKRDDEFGELATAFDQMSHRLGRQFASLNALSQVDRLILATQDTAQVIRTVLHGLGDIVSADLVTATLLDNDSPDHARTYFRPREAKDSMSMLRHDVTADARAALQADATSRKVALAAVEGLPFYLEPAGREGYVGAYVQPIIWRGAVCGVLTLAYRSPAEPSEEERRHVAELADRIAVAVSSAWREEQLYVQAHFDPLTGMPNRLLFMDRLDREIARSQRERLHFAVLLIDLDHFKNVNDSFGHGTGDEVLRESARRITRCVRDADTVARLGGDEFVLLLTRLGQPEEALQIAESIVKTLSDEFIVGEHRSFLSASVGISSFPADGQGAEILLKNADTAMYRAKASGRAQAMFFEERMNSEAVARQMLDRDLRAAIDRGELELHYQPQLEIRTGAIRGAEALVRWNHPIHGYIPPMRFIALAEESGFIEPLGRWILQRACEQLQQWRSQGIGIDRLAVNVSPRQFRRRTLSAFIAECIARTGLKASNLELEITEGLLIDRGEEVEGLLAELEKAGHQISLDDFGTGFSSLSYLQRFPVHTIKIDRVFVVGLERGETLPIVEAIIAMSHALGKTVIAEGVETAAQLEALRRLQCDEVQGYLISRALPAEEFVRFLGQWPMHPASSSISIATH